LEKVSLFGSHFSWERYGQSILNFDIDSKVSYSYRLIPRKLNFFGWLAVFGITSASRFRGLLVAIMAPYNIKVLVSGY
jgi:hypothetical protein